MAAGTVTTYYNTFLPRGAPIDGLNDEHFGNFKAHAGPDGAYVDSDDTLGARSSPQGDVRYFQGDVGTHGQHILLIADSDNAQLTVPVDEIDTEQRQVILHGRQGNVGEVYGHSFDRPLVPTTALRSF